MRVREEFNAVRFWIAAVIWAWRAVGERARWAALKCSWRAEMQLIVAIRSRRGVDFMMLLLISIYFKIRI